MAESIDLCSLRKGDLVLVEVLYRNSLRLHPALVMSDPPTRRPPNLHHTFNDRIAVVIESMAMASTGVSIKRHISNRRRSARPIAPGFKRKTAIPLEGTDLEYDVLFRAVTIELVQKYLSDRIIAAEVARPGVTL